MSRCKNDFHHWKRRKTRDESHSASGARGKTAETVDDYTTTLGYEDQFKATEDTQSEFGAIKDTLIKVKLPADLSLCDSPQEIRRSALTYNIFSRCAWYAETSIKLSSLITEGNLADDSVQQLFAIQLAQILYVKEQYSVLVVQSHFDESTARIFRSLQRNTSSLTPDALQQLKPQHQQRPERKKVHPQGL